MLLTGNIGDLYRQNVSMITAAQSKLGKEIHINKGEKYSSSSCTNENYPYFTKGIKREGNLAGMHSLHLQNLFAIILEEVEA